METEYKEPATERVLATGGYSCRSQVKRFEGGEVVRHPVQVLASLFSA
ncbi:Fe-S protein, homolog of lactate dehydrogenase SO1521 [Vibrio sp. JCM 18905]|nr:Fe-S protein, homolog of lactate dehydrogenase SO1521 [Vibrio sp. JCM 18905]